MSAVEVVPAGSPQATDEVTIWSRWSDRLNPILVREVQQAVKGRVFPLTILLALGISIVIATVVAAEYVDGGTGRGAFDAGIATLVPLVLFVIPMQAYNSMRTELRGGIVEQLLLSRLGPGAVLFGKLQAAMVQFVLYVSVLAPLLATSYLLRGVDLPSIALSLLFASVLCLAATAFAVSSAAQAIVPALQPIANLGIAFGLGVGTISMISFVASSAYSASIGWLLRSSQFGMVVSSVVLLAGLSTTLSWLAARTFLLHAFENKSTAFRVFLFLLPVLAYGWMLLFVPAADWRQAFPTLTFTLLLAGVMFGIFMVTEQRALSPRVHAHVPRSAMRARFMALLLPGRDRGLLCFVTYITLLLVIAAVFWPNLGAGASGRIMRWMGPAGLMTIGYALVYLGLGRWVRDRLPDNLRGNHAGRFMLPVMLFLFCLVPVLVDLVTRPGVHRWHFGHIMNPFWTIDKWAGNWSDAQWFLFPVLLVTLLLQLPVFFRGVREVAKASTERRSREQRTTEGG
jgi:hypothetical protein